MSEYIPGNVYKNLQQLYKYRKITPTEDFLSIDEFSQQLTYHEFILMRGIRHMRKTDYLYDTNNKNDKINVFIILISPTSNKALKTQDFKKLLNTIPSGIPNGADIIIVSRDLLKIQLTKYIKNLHDVIKHYHYEYYSYNSFLIEFPKHVSIPKHEIANDDEINDFCNKYKKQKNTLPKICESDPGCIWIGARFGDVVKITRPSETSGYAIAYRVVIKDN